MTHIGSKPKFAALKNAPAEGDSCVFDIRNATTGARVAAASSLLGPGRDYIDIDEAAKHLVNVPADENFEGISSTIHGPYATITELLAEFPDAKLDGTAKRLYAAELATIEYRAAVAKWEAAVEAAGLEPCDRCGGEGGWQGWPGFTCYKCQGRGTQELS